MLRFFAGIFELRVIECELRRCDGELRITIEPFQTMRRKKCLRVPIANLACTSHAESAGIEACDFVDTALLGENSVPKILAPMSDASDWTDTGDDNTSSTHAVTLFAFVSTFVFYHRNVLLLLLYL